MSALHGLETITATRWINQRLAADDVLQDLAGDTLLAELVWEGVAPEEVTAPWWITFTLDPARDVKVVSMIQVMSHVPLRVKVTAPGRDYTPIVPVYQRVHDLLESQANQPVTPGGLMLTCERVSAVQYPERTNGVEYRHLGGLYEATIQ